MAPRLSKVLSRAGHTFRERDFSILCPSCDEVRGIPDCVTKATTEARTYRCADCSGLLVVIGWPSYRQLSDERCREGDWWTIRPTSDLIIRLGSDQLTIPAVTGARTFGEPLI